MAEGTDGLAIDGSVTAVEPDRLLGSPVDLRLAPQGAVRAGRTSRLASAFFVPKLHGLVSYFVLARDQDRTPE